MNYLFALCILLGVSSAHAQDTCKTYTHKNPHGAAMTISRVWILDSVNFTVRPIQTLPYQETASGSFDFEVCIIPRDGKKYSTQVRYQTTHGPVSYNISNFVAPSGTSSVREEGPVTRPVISPNPARHSISISGPIGSSWNISSFAGTALLSGSMHSDEERIDISMLPAGAYMLSIIAEDQEQTSQKFVKE